MFWRARTRQFRFDPAVDQILLSHLHEEVSVETNVLIHVVGGLLGLLNVQVEALVQHFYCLCFVTFQAPFH